jgi:hypothetical protein
MVQASWNACLSTFDHGLDPPSMSRVEENEELPPDAAPEPAFEPVRALLGLSLIFLH